jgi:diguanylate cyclase (GGDEF)-like protein
MNLRGPTVDEGSVGIAANAAKAALLQVALDTTSQGIVVFASDLRIMARNTQFLKLLGADWPSGEDPEEPPEVSLKDLVSKSDALTPRSRQRLLSFITDGINGGLSPDGSVIRVEAASGLKLSAVLKPTPEGQWSAQIEVLPPVAKSGGEETSLDPLTGLPNRAALRNRLLQACADLQIGNVPFAVLVVDLDRFKSVNDTLGHPIGDALLRKVSERLQSAVRADDMVCRTGGDEFAVVIANQSKSDVASAASRIVELMKRPFLLRGDVVNVGASVGVALAPQDAADADTLLVQADLAFCQAKANGGGTYDFFRPELQERALARRTLEQELRKALALHQYELFYQPQIDVDTGRLSGFTAVLRWKSPTRGFVNPTAFMPLLEELGLILPVGDWVLRTACMAAMKWPENLSVAVNVPASQFESDHLVSAVADALSASGLPAKRLEIEVSETALLHNGEATRAALHVLRRMGVRLAMDESGAGYHSFPFDRIKIDRSFVDAILGSRTRVEGAETAEQLKQIRSGGPTDVKGYLLGQPVSGKDLGAVIEALNVDATAAKTPEAASSSKRSQA